MKRLMDDLTSDILLLEAIGKRHIRHNCGVAISDVSCFNNIKSYIQCIVNNSKKGLHQVGTLSFYDVMCIKKGIYPATPVRKKNVNIDIYDEVEAIKTIFPILDKMEKYYMKYGKTYGLYVTILMGTYKK